MSDNIQPADHVGDERGHPQVEVELAHEQGAIYCDVLLGPLIKALNDGGFPTIASCQEQFEANVISEQPDGSRLLEPVGIAWVAFRDRGIAERFVAIVGRGDIFEPDTPTQEQIEAGAAKYITPGAVGVGFPTRYIDAVTAAFVAAP